MVDIHDPQQSQAPAGFALFRLGFRPFFLFAAAFAVLGMVQWVLVYHGFYSFNPGNLTVLQWHAHEMIFGYAMAVIAGFLLTSVRNWTGQQTPVGSMLAIMAAFWLMARLGFAAGSTGIFLGVMANLVFMAGFLWSISTRIVSVRQWQQGGILLVLLLLTLAEVGVLIGLEQRDQWIVSKAIYGAFYLVLMMILIMGRRVVPFFIERGVGYPCTLKQSRLLDVAVVAGFALYILSNLFVVPPELTAAIAAVVVVAQSIRLKNWYTPGIWKKPLLWSLYLALAWITVGLSMAALTPWLDISSYLVLHTFAVGGVGLVTLSMMSRVALGHTGRDVHNPAGIVRISLAVLILAIVFRVVMPLFVPASHSLWIGISQLLWISAFGLFLLNYLPMLVGPRIDGRPG